MSPLSQDSIDTTAMRLQSMLARAIHEVRRSFHGCDTLADVFHSADFQTVFAVQEGISGTATRYYIAYLQRVHEGKLFTFGMRLDYADAYEDVRNALAKAQQDFEKEVREMLHP